MRILLILILLPFVTAVNAREPEGLFTEANEYYAEGDYEKAIDLYLMIDSMGYASSDLYYNTANAYFRSNKLGKARLFYERASLFDPADDDIEANLQYTRSLLSDRFEEVPVLFFVRWYQDLRNMFSSNLWSVFSMAFFILALGSFFVYVFVASSAAKRIGFFTGLAALFISILTLIFAYQQNRKPDAAIVMAPSLTVKSAPRNSGKDLFILHEGSKIWVLDDLEGWKEIRISDGRKGWIPRGKIEKI